MVTQKRINNAIAIAMIILFLIVIATAILAIFAIIYATTTDNGTQGPPGLRGPTGAIGSAPIVTPYQYDNVSRLFYNKTNNVITFTPGTLFIVDGKIGCDNELNIRLPNDTSGLQEGDTITIFNNALTEALNKGLVIKVNGTTLLAPRSSNPPLTPDRTFVSDLLVNNAISLTLVGRGDPVYVLAISSR